MATLTREVVLQVLGPLDDQTAAEILATGASEQELREALAWLGSDEALVDEHRPFPTGRTAELVDILAAPVGLPDDED